MKRLSQVMLFALFAAWSAGPASAQLLVPDVSDIRNLVSNGMTLSPGAFAMLVGENLAGSTANCATAQGLPTDWCADVQVKLSDTSREYFAALSTVAPKVIVAQMPTELPAGTYALTVVRRAGSASSRSPWLTIVLQAYAPGLYTRDMSGTGLGQFLNVDNKEITAGNPPKPGDWISVFAGGLGRTNPVVATGRTSSSPVPTVTTPSVTVAGQTAALKYAVLIPGQVGMFQVNFQVPASTPAGEQPVVLEIGGRQSNTVLLPVAGTPGPHIDWIVNAASDGPGLVSGSWMAVHGANLASTTRIWTNTDFAGNKLPTSLDAVRVSVNGKPAAIYYISPTQINAQVPTDSAVGTITVEVQNSLGTARKEATLQPLAPAFFLFLGVGQNKYLAGVYPDFVYLGKRNLFGGAVVTRPARSGDVILLFGTGFGATNPPLPAGEILAGAAPLSDPKKLTIKIGGVPAQVQYAGLVGAGLYQFNVVVPRVPAGDQPVVAEIGGLTSPAGKYITIE